MQEAETPCEFLTTEELAARWHTTSAGVLNMRHRGNAPKGHRIGKRVLFRRSDVERFEAGKADDAVA